MGAFIDVPSPALKVGSVTYFLVDGKEETLASFLIPGIELE